MDHETVARSAQCKSKLIGRFLFENQIRKTNKIEIQFMKMTNRWNVSHNILIAANEMMLWTRFIEFSRHM